MIIDTTKIYKKIIKSVKCITKKAWMTLSLKHRIQIKNLSVLLIFLFILSHTHIYISF